MDDDYKKLVKEYRQLAKSADTRLLNLEKLSNKKGFQDVKQYSYARAVRDIKSWDNKGGTKDPTAAGYVPRFNTAPPKRIDSLEAKIADIKHFLDAPTSTESRITAKYGKMAETVNKRYGTDFTWQDLVNYYETVQSKNNDARYGSKTIIKAIAIIKNIGPDPDDIKAARSKNTRLSDDVEVDALAHTLLKKGQTATKLFGMD